MLLIYKSYVVDQVRLVTVTPPSQTEGQGWKDTTYQKRELHVLYLLH